MIKTPNISSIAIVTIIILFSFSQSGFCGTITIDRWLLLGPAEAPIVAFGEEEALETALNEEMLDLGDEFPALGGEIEWYPGENYRWEEVSGEVIELKGDFAQPAVAYLAAYIFSERRQNLTVNIETPYPAALFVDGVNKAQTSQTGGENVPNFLTCKADLHSGKHLIILKAVKPADSDSLSWTVKGSVEAEFEDSRVEASIDPSRYFYDYKDYARIERLGKTVLSKDGSKAAMVRTKRNLDDYKSHSRIEVYSSKTGELLNQIDMMKSISNPLFSSEDADILFFKVSNCIYRMDLKNNAIEKVFDEIKGLNKYIISPNAEYIYYTADGKRPVKGTDDYTLQTTLEERLTDWYSARKLYIGSLTDGAVHCLSRTGDYEINDFGLSPEGDKIVFTRRVASPGRPYMDTEFWLYDLKKREYRKLISRKIPFETRPQNLTILPGGKYMVYTSASYYTDDPEALKHNLSEVDLWLMDLETSEERNLTGDTPFTVDEGGGSWGSLMWNPRDKRIWFPVMMGAYNRIYSIDPFKPASLREEKFSENYIKDIYLSAEGKTISFTSQGLDYPAEAYVYNLKSRKQLVKVDPNEGIERLYTFSNFERWNFSNRLGHQIDGWIFYPPDFDPAKKYPLIVYYYAGVWMLDESFYFPYHFWAANGYLVYALTPVGAMAHGDAFSDYHVNDWGTNATQDIIEGVEKLTAEKDFIDAEHIGCYGGSYGGFTTMDLITKTDIFACAVSMYGISDIASYWGGGIWGYTYGDIALANSYPWKDKKLFTENSPLFNADKIKTPLLLLHGADDVNVPALESEQLFTALRVQNKDVAYVKFPGEGHGIAGNFEHYIAHREMMLEWFDQYLKGQPEGWERRWK